MSQKIKELFSQLSPIHKRNLLRELSDEFDCEVNLDLIQSLKYQISQKDIEIGQLKSTIDELTDYKAPLDVLYSSIPKKERDKIKRQICGAHIYKMICSENRKLQSRIKSQKELISNLVYQINNK